MESAAERRGAGPGGNTGEEKEIDLLTWSWLASGSFVGSIWPGVFGSWRGLLTVFFVVPAFDVRYVWLTPR